VCNLQSTAQVLIKLHHTAAWWDSNLCDGHFYRWTNQDFFLVSKSEIKHHFW